MKRALSTPSPPSSLKRPKPEANDAKPPCTPPPLPPTAPHGVERIPLPPCVNVHRLSSQQLHHLASERTQALRAQGRHVVGLPVVLSDGIVLNWYSKRSAPASLQSLTFDRVLHKSSSVGLVGPRNGWFPQRERLRAATSSAGSGASAADAIVIVSDDDLNDASSLPRTHTPKYLRGPSSNRDVRTDHSDSDIELLSDNRARDGPHTLPLARELSPEDSSDMDISDPPPSRALPVAAARLGVRANHADLATSDSEVDEADNESEATLGSSDNRISTRHAKPPSLRPIRKLLARTKRQDGPERAVLPQGAIVVPEGSQKPERNEFLEEPPAITSSESDNDEPDHQASDPQLKRVPLPKTVHGRARRLVVPESAELPLVAITMRGDCHFIERKKKFRITGYSLPNPGVFRHVEDVCMVGDTAVLGCDKAHTRFRSFLSRVSIAHEQGKPRMIDVAWSPHSSGPRYQDMQNSKRGVSRLAAVHAAAGHIKFLTGGYDGTIHKWTAAVDNLSEPRSRKVVSHGACIMALAYRDRDRSVVASAQRRLHITDLNRCTTMTHLFSNVIQQIHIHPQAADVTLLEVQHLDRQIQLYDSRKGDFDGEPCLSFGRRNASGKFLRGHTRGSVHLVHFAKATEDGCVLLWDFRNSKRAVVETCFEQAEKVVHTIFADADIATFGQGVVTFFEDYLASM